jgi:uncharacterized protein YdhG (YjbR/CyaY superfamily)
MAKRAVFATVDDYIAACPANVQAILQKIRTMIRKAAPAADERVSYGMPAFFQDGALVYFAAFKNHIGMFPPVRGDKELLKDLSAHCGPKGNLKFALDDKMPYALIRRVIRFQVWSHAARLKAKRRKK